MENENLTQATAIVTPTTNTVNTNLQQSTIGATITATGANDGAAAGAGAPEDTAQAYQATISQQGDTIDALIAANERLQQQIQRMLRMGAPITDNDTGTVNQNSGSASLDSGINPPDQLTPEQIMSKPEYEPLAALGKEIGKKPKKE